MHYNVVFTWTHIIIMATASPPLKAAGVRHPRGPRAINPGFNYCRPNENWFRMHNCNYAYNACPSQLFSGLVFGQMLMLFHVWWLSMFILALTSWTAAWQAGLQAGSSSSWPYHILSAPQRLCTFQACISLVDIWTICSAIAPFKRLLNFEVPSTSFPIESRPPNTTPTPFRNKTPRTQGINSRSLPIGVHEQNAPNTLAH